MTFWYLLKFLILCCEEVYDIHSTGYNLRSRFIIIIQATKLYKLRDTITIFKMRFHRDKAHNVPQCRYALLIHFLFSRERIFGASDKQLRVSLKAQLQL